MTDISNHISVSKWKRYFLGLVLSMVIFAFCIMMLLKLSPVYKYTIESVSNNTQVSNMLGRPIIPGFFVKGKISWTGPGGLTYMYIPIKGPKGRAVVFVYAEKHNGVWEYQFLKVILDNKNEINLLTE